MSANWEPSADVLYTLDFVEDEFVQAGLLPDAGQISPVSSAGKPGTPTIQPEVRTSLHDSSPPVAGNAQTPHRQKQFPRHIQGSGKELDTLGHKKQVNKEHQRRFRARQKVRSQKLEDQLTKLTEELEMMKLQQKLLEKQLANGDTAAAAPLTPESHFMADPAKTEPPLKVALPGRAYQLTVADVINMPTHDFNSLCRDFVKELRNCLSAMKFNANDHIRDKLAQLVLPALRLRGTRCVARNALPDDATYTPEVDESWQLKESLALSQNQFEDLLFLQRVYVLKRHELCEKRAGLTDQIQNGSQNFLVDVSKMSGIATELKQNASSALQLAKKFCWALYFGVLTMEQSAHVIMQLGLPKSPTEDALQNIAANRVLPTTEEIITGQDGPLTSQLWDRFWNYAQSMNPYEKTRFEYVPIPEAQSNGMTLKLY